MKKITLTLECSDADIAAYLMLLYVIYEEGENGADLLLARQLPEAIGFLKDQVRYLVDDDGNYLDGKQVLFRFRGCDWAVIRNFLDDKDNTRQERDALLAMTVLLDEHPEGYDGPCQCKLCRSYGG